MGIATVTILAFGVIFFIFCIVFIINYKKLDEKKAYWFAIPSLILAVWSFSTSWMWFYYFCLYLSIPAFLISFILLIMAMRFKIKTSFLRIIIGLYIATLMFSISSAVFFNII